MSLRILEFYLKVNKYFESNLIQIILLSILGIALFNQSLNFALAGDDWGSLYRFISTSTNTDSHFNIKNFTSNYFFADFLMGQIYKMFGTEPFYYYLISLILRIFACISLFLQISFITKKSSIGFLAAIIFLSLFAGIETTDWVFNMNTYISFILLNTFIIIFASKNLNKFTIILLSLLLVLTFATSPSRMHGLFIFIPIFVTTIKVSLSFKNNLLILFIGFLLITPAVLYRIASNPPSDSFSVFSSILNHQFNGLDIYFMLANIGMTFIPNQLLTTFIPPNLHTNPEQILNFIQLIFLSSTITLPFFMVGGLLYFKKFIYLNLTFNVILSTVFWILLIIDKTNNFTNPILILNALLGGTIIFYFIIFFIYSKNILSAKYGLAYCFGIITFLLIPWLINPLAIPASYHRYLLIPGGLLIACYSIAAHIIFVNKSKLAKFIYGFYLLGVIIINIYATDSYLYRQNEIGRSAITVNNYFSQFKNFTPSDRTKPSVFLFETNDPETLHNAIKFGFGFHLMIINPNLIQDFQLQPLAVDSYDSLVEILIDINSYELHRYGYKPVAIPLTNVYGYKIIKGQIFDQTPQLRNKLKKTLSNKSFQKIDSSPN